MASRLVQTIRSMQQGIAWHMRYGPKAPKAGDLAPDFELTDAAGERTVRLHDFQGKGPVALVFGSFT